MSALVVVAGQAAAALRRLDAEAADEEAARMQRNAEEADRQGGAEVGFEIGEAARTSGYLTCFLFFRATYCYKVVDDGGCMGCGSGCGCDGGIVRGVVFSVQGLLRKHVPVCTTVEFRVFRVWRGWGCASMYAPPHLHRLTPCVS